MTSPSISADGQCFSPLAYTRLDEFCGGDPHIAASAQAHTNTASTWDIDIDSIDEAETLERIAMYWHNPVDRDAIAAELDTLEALRSRVLTP